MLRHFDEGSFWKAVKRYARTVSFVPDALALYYCMIDDATPLATRGAIAFALVYFVVPTDAIPDWVPLAGMVDDSAVLAVTFSLVQAHVTPEHRRRAQEWFEQ